ncbi:MAG: DUF962 domain-containing protein [Sphingomonadales bacterium]
MTDIPRSPAGPPDQTAAGAARITTFADFFDHYLIEHSDPRTRALHYTGTLTGLALFVVFLVTLNVWFLVGAFVAGYGLAWLGHLLFEGNRPTTLRYPLWSFISDFRMLGLWISDRLGDALARAATKSERSHNSVNNSGIRD